jgi:hypothetical protein
LRGLVGTGLGAQQRQEQLNSQALKIQQKFFQRLPAEIEDSIRSRLPPAEWAHKVVEHVVGTLGTIIEMSGVENSASSSELLQLK